MCEYNDTLLEFGDLIREKTFNPFEGPLKVGVDLGTANIVLAVVDSENKPIAGATYPSTVVKDGIVVDFIGASKAVRKMKADLEEIILASNANIGGPTTAAALAIAKGWKDLIGPILVVGTLGYIIGNYVGTLLGFWFASMM